MRGLHTNVDKVLYTRLVRLIGSAKSRSARGASHQPAFTGSCQTISRICLPCLLPSGRTLLFWSDLSVVRKVVSRERRESGEPGKWKRWEGSELERWERREGSELGRWEISELGRWDALLINL